jgi:hypothetical protein
MPVITGGIPHSIPEGCLKLAESFESRHLGAERLFNNAETEAALSIVGRLME